MKTSILTDLSRNIDGYFDIKYWWIFWIETHENVKKTSKNNIRSNNTYIIINIWRNLYINDIIYNIL